MPTINVSPVLNLNFGIITQNIFQTGLNVNVLSFAPVAQSVSSIGGNNGVLNFGW